MKYTLHIAVALSATLVVSLAQIKVSFSQSADLPIPELSHRGGGRR